MSDKSGLQDLLDLFDSFQDETNVVQDQTIEGLEFKATCYGCPEQYDVFLENEQVGYVRLRHGTLRVDYPSHSGETILETEGVEGDGIFTKEERPFWLRQAALAIYHRMCND